MVAVEGYGSVRLLICVNRAEVWDREVVFRETNKLTFRIRTVQLVDGRVHRPSHFPSPTVGHRKFVQVGIITYSNRLQWSSTIRLSRSALSTWPSLQTRALPSMTVLVSSVRSLNTEPGWITPWNAKVWQAFQLWARNDMHLSREASPFPRWPTVNTRVSTLRQRIQWTHSATVRAIGQEAHNSKSKEVEKGSHRPSHRAFETRKRGWKMSITPAWSQHPWTSHE